MDMHRVCFLLLILNIVVLAEDISGSTNDTEKSEIRQPRVNGRIVKLYSGTRPEPIYCPHEGFQPDPTNCAIFYRCVRGANDKFTVFRFQCGPGTIYDPDTEVCNFPQSTKRSNCGGIAIPSTDKNNENEIEETPHEFPSPINTRPVYSEAIKESTTQNAYPWAPAKLENPQPSSTAYPWMTSGSIQNSPTKGTTLQLPPSRQTGDACTKDGFMGDSENCRKFYRCVNNQRGGFIRYEFSCSETTVWDDDAQSCNHPWAVQRSRCGRSNTNDINSFSTNEELSSNKMPSPATSIQEQLQINYGQKVTQTQTQISHGQVIQNQTQINYGDRNDKKQSSQVKQNQTQISHGSAISQTQTQINYGNGVQSQLQVDHTKESSQSQSQTYETTSEKSTTSSTSPLEDEDQGYGMQPSTEGNSDEINNNNECTESGFMGDKNDCKKFYRCVDNGKGSYIKYEFSCGEGTVWDSSIEGCNHAWAVKECGGNAPQNSPQNAPPTTTTTKPTQDSQTTFEMTTSDDSEDTGYGNQNQQTQSTTQSTTTQSKPVTTTSSSSDGALCTSSGFMGDSNNCNKFYRCVDNGKGSYTRYEFNCGEGTVWDPDIEACNHQWAVKKCGGSSTDINKIETTTAQSTAITVSLVQMTTQASSENLDYDSGYGQQQSSSTSLTTRNPLENTLSTEQSTNGQPTTGKECSQEGFMGDRNDCKKFYRCVDNGNGGFTKYEFICGEGTVWDSEITACNHPKSAKSCNSDSSSQGENIAENPQTSTTTQSSQATVTQITDELISTSQPVSTSKPSPSKDCSQEGFMGDESDCKRFYRCVDNGKGGFTKYEFSCGEGTVWDSEIDACNHPSSNKQCGDSGAQIHTEPNRENDETYTEPTNALTSSTEQSPTTTSLQKPSASNDKCTSEGFYGDSSDCKKFYRCVDNGKGGFTKYEFACGDGTIWDQEIQACNHEPTDSKCSKNSQSTQSQTDSNDADTTISTSTTQQPQSTQKPQTSPSQSYSNCTDEGFYANPEDCRKFYRCVDNGKGGYTKYDFSCGEGTMWVQEIQACDHDTGESCSSQSESSSSTTESVNEQQPSTSSGSNSSSSTQQPDKQEDENPNPPSSDSSSSSSDGTEKCSAEGFYPNTKDCRKFYRCVDNGNGGYTKYDFTCGEGTAWDSNIQSCNHISEVENCKGQEQETSQPVQDEQVSQSPEESQTSTSGPATESSKPASKDTCEQEGYYGNSQDCTKFYRCVDNGNGGLTKYDFDCGEGTIWDQDITACNHPRDVTNLSCQQSESSTSSSSTTGSSSSSSSESSSSTTEGSSSDCSQGSTKKPDKKNVNCTKAGYYPDPDDCKKFYRCVDWDGDGKRFSVYHFDCGEGTIWDPALDTCNHEDSVYPPRDCSGGSQSQGENVSQETTESTSTTSDSGTTQESSTEQTTTAQSTTTEQSTTEQTTTSEQTTTQQTTTSEQSTTEPTTTSEQTTTQQSTTSEQTTTQQSSTSEQTTTQQSTTSEPTTQQLTTTEQTTTQQSTTEESTTTQKTTTSEQTTTEESTTEHTTTTTESEQQSTTQQTTDTDGTTTEGSTTESSTTEGTTTEGTTEQSTTSQTDESETTESTTSSTTQESTTESSGDQTTESSSDKECPETDEDQNLFVCPTSFKRHPKYCNMFYQCTEDDDTHDVQIATFHCPNNTIYDESKIQCVEEKKADKKCDGEMARKRRLKRFDVIYKEPIVVTNERLKCPAAGHYPFEKGECSPAFLKCQITKAGKLRGFIYQCPQDYVYWSVSRRCEQKSHVRDCKKSHNDWRGRWEIPIERRNVASR